MCFPLVCADLYPTLVSAWWRKVNALFKLRAMAIRQNTELIGRTAELAIVCIKQMSGDLYEAGHQRPCGAEKDDKREQWQDLG